MESLTDIILSYRYYIEITAITIAVITAVSSVDDVFIDLYYWCLRLFGRQDAKDQAFAREISRRKHVAERPFAIMVPAWKERDVIFSMLATNSRLLAYKNCHYFIGVYQNDGGTIAEVRRAQAVYANIHTVIVPRDGPTSKADCLNEVIASILAYEVDSRFIFAGIVLHDAEDFIHPHELSVFDSLIGQFDFVQLPVFSFTRTLRDMVGGIYMDEFAEVHTKDLIVRKYLSGLIPCAGVSACFSRNAIAMLAQSNRGEVFRTSCFTEDYDIAFRLRALGLKTTFVSCPVNYTIDMDHETIAPVYVKRSLPLATREFFPSELRGAYRQRARWLTGIVFQGTSSHGWKGNWGTRYFLFRDRKGIITSPAVMLGYFVLANFVLIESYLATYQPGKLFDYALLSQDYVMDLFIINLGFLLWRLLHRMIFTTRLYSWRHGLMAAPRLVVSNFVNFFASVRATRIYLVHIVTGKPLVWDKTAHSYPIKLLKPRPAQSIRRDSAILEDERGAPMPGASIRPLATIPRRSARRIATLLIIAFPIWCELAPINATRARAQSASANTAGNVADVKLNSMKVEADIRSARGAIAADPAAEVPVINLIDGLVRIGRKQEALAEANRFMARGKAGAALYAQRGFLRREFGDLTGAIEDFSEAYKRKSELSADQRVNVENAFAEAKTAQMQADLNQAQSDLTAKAYAQAARRAQAILQTYPRSEPAMRIRIEALAADGQKRLALTEADRFVAAGAASSTLLAQRAFLRRELNDIAGAEADFTAALGGRDLTTEQRKNVEAGLLEARAAESQADLDRAAIALKRRDLNTVLSATDAVLQRNPNSEDAMLMRIEALSTARRNREALAEADKFIAQNTASATFRAQRGFLRRGQHDLAGAISDFTDVLNSGDLSVEQRRNIQTALAEARMAAGQSDFNRAQTALVRGDFNTAADIAEGILRRDPKSEPAMRIRVDALVRGGRQREAQAEVDRFISQGRASGWMIAQRGFLRRDTKDFQGAVEDFDAALGRRDLDRQSAPNIRYARAEAAAMLAEQRGDPRAAEASYRAFVEAEPTQADGWFKLGYLLIGHGQRAQGAEALDKGLKIRPVGSGYLDAADAYVYTNAPMASRLYRQGLDRLYAGDPSLAGRSQAEIERIKNAVVEADATIRTTVSFGGISGRPEAAGGSNNIFAAETRVRFDGRYLAAVPGLEAFARGYSGQDSNAERETEVAAGLRFRPIRDLNLYIAGSVDHFFQPRSQTEFVLSWGLGLGANAYPYIEGWKPYWDFGAFGAWRTADGRLLQDARGNAGVLYQFRSPVRGAIGPTILASAGYDNQANTPWAAGIGPSVLSYFWLGGDKYRSYDALLSLQVGYLFNVGNDSRQSGWRGQVGMTF